MQLNYQPSVAHSRELFTKLLLLIPLFSILFVSNISGQCVNIPECEDALDVQLPVSGLGMPGPGSSNGDIPGCEGIFNNTAWFTFTTGPGTDYIEVVILPTNCTSVPSGGGGGNISGIQAGIYSTCNTETPSIGDVLCSCFATPVDLTIQGDVMPNTTYFIMVDGCGGSECDIEIQINQGTTVSGGGGLVAPEAPLTDDDDNMVCPGQVIMFDVNLGAGVSSYTWDLPPDATIISNDCNTITVEWGSTDWDVFATAEDAEGNTAMGASTSITVIQEEYDYTAYYCRDDNDPSAGFEFWGDGMTYQEGDYTVMSEAQTADECDTLVNLTVIENFINEPDFITEMPTCNELNDLETGGIAFDDGLASVLMNGPGFNYSYQWSNDPSNTGPNGTGFEAGFHTVTITDEDTGCSIIREFEIEERPELTPLITIDSQPSCGSSADGEVTLYAEGGTPDYLFNWPIPGTDQGNRDDLPAGYYEVTIVDDNGCTVLAEFTLVSGGSSFTVNESITPATCGEDNGSVTLSVPGGSGPYTYNWDGGASGASRNGLAAGSYPVTVSDGSCDVELTVEIPSSGSIPSIVIDNTSDESCPGAENGTASLSGTGGTPNYIFTWPSNITGANRSDLAAGSYIVTIEDADGCQNTNEVIIGIGTGISNVDFTTQNVDCFQADNGEINITNVDGGNPNYTYTVLDGIVPIGNSSGTSITDLPAGNNYTLQVTDADDCTYTETFSITQPTALQLDLQASNVTCGGANNGSVTALASGGDGNYTYEWADQNGALSETGNALINLGGGTYSVTVTDNNNPNCTIEDNVTVQGGGSLSFSEDNRQEIECFGDMDGAVTIIPSGGVAPYTFTWDDFPTNRSATLNNVEAGTYEYSVVDDNGCSGMGSVTFTQPDLLTGSILNGSVQGATCDGNDGQAQVTALGGVGSYSYNWVESGETTALASNLPAGSNDVIITDDNMCTTTVTVVIPDPIAVTATLNNVDNISCNGNNDGSVTIDASDGDGDFEYNIGNGNQDSNTFNNLPAGNYEVTVTDGNNCTAIVNNITIVEPDEIQAYFSVQDISCNGFSDGEITVNPRGGTVTSTYTYQWSDGAGTAQTATGLSAQQYFVTVTDNNSCMQVFDTTIVENPALVLSIDDTQDANCDGSVGGTAEISATGGDGNYTFDWENGTANGDGSAASDLPVGNTDVTVTDGNGCTDIATVNIGQPDGFTLSIQNTTDALCNGDLGSATIIANGGVAPFTITWNNAGPNDFTNNNLIPNVNYTVEVEDAESCTETIMLSIDEPDIITVNETVTQITCAEANNASISITATGGQGNYTYDIGNGPQSSNVFDNLAPNSYTVQVVDANNCTASSVEININEPSPIEAYFSVQDISCNGLSDGEITVNPRGGTISSNYSYQWSDGAGTAQTATGLSAQQYFVTITDDNSCTQVFDTTIVENPALVLSIDDVQNANCDGSVGGSASVSATGGDGNYTFSWDTNATLNADASMATDLPVGTIMVSVQDGNSCTDSEPIIIGQPTSFTLDVASQTDALCNGDMGAATIDITGGTAPFTITWNGMGPNDLSNSNLIPNQNYIVEVVDANDCRESIDVMISEPDAVTATLNPQNISCFGDNNGSVEIAAAGGNSNYTYDIGNGPQSSNIFTDLLPDVSYSVTVVDGNGCTSNPASYEFTLSEPDSISVDIDVTNVLCYGASTGEINLAPSGGTVNSLADYNYTWSNALPNSATVTNLSAGTYTVTVADLNNCTNVFTINIEEATELSVSIDNINPTQCDGFANGSANAIANGGNDATYTYQWSSGTANGNSVTDLMAGPISVTVTDASGCAATDSGVVLSPDAIMASATVINNVSCNGGNDGSASVTANGGDGSFTYLWDSGEITQTAIQLDEGVHSVTITDGAGCESIIDDVSISQPSPLDWGQITIVEATCGLDIGSIDITVVGGTEPYSYNWNTATNMNEEDQSNLAASNYSVTVVDANNCSIDRAFSVVSPGEVRVDPEVTAVTCNGQADGSIELVIMDGQSPYAIVWENYSGTETTRNGLATGIYNVTVTDADDCEVPLSITVPEPDLLEATASGGVSDCTTDNGTTSLIVNGGVEPYRYLWSGNGNTYQDQNLTDIPAGNYDVTVYDANDCEAYASAVVTNPDSPVLTAVENDVLCFGESTGSIELTISGGSGGNTITWDPAELNGLSNPTNLSAGNYAVTVTDNSGCTASGSYVINQPTEEISVTSENIIPVTCGATNGEVSITATGGTGDLSYNWSAGTANGNTVTDLGPGTVSLTITDENNCTYTDSYNVTAPGGVQVTLNSIQNETCFNANDGAIDINVSGGNSSNYQFDWGAGIPAVEDPNGLAPGQYEVSVTDGTCPDPITLPVEIIAATEITANLVEIQASCGQSDGGINITVSGGTVDQIGYTYQWDFNNSTDEDLSNAPAGTYTVIVTDENGCSETFSHAITNPDAPQISFTQTDVLCFGESTGSIDLSIAQGTMPFNFDWSDNALDGMEDPSNLSAGTYEVTVTDTQNCTDTETITISEPSDVSITLDGIVEASCVSPGSIDVTVQGGTPPYTYSWTGGSTEEDPNNLTPGNYILTVTDANNCEYYSDAYDVSAPNALSVQLAPNGQSNNDCPGDTNGRIEVEVVGGTAGFDFEWSDGVAGNTNIADNLPGGTYVVTVTDAAGCEASLPVEITEPNPIVITGSATDADCGVDNGSITSMVQGGTAPYTFQWSNGADPVQNPSGLPTGFYELTLTDANGCINTDFSQNISTPSGFGVIAEPSDVSCNGLNDGSIVLTISGGTPPFTVDWSDDQYDGQTSVSNLSSGTYDIVVTDADNCDFLLNGIVINEPPVLTAFVVQAQSETSCFGSDDGSIDLTVSGGTMPYTYNWSGGLSSIEDPSGLSAGSYQVTVTDANNCTATSSAVITEPADLNVSSDNIDPSSCSDTSDGAISISVSGGTPTYTYDWNNGQYSTEDISGLAAGTYTLQITDENDCQYDGGEFIVSSPDPVRINLSDVSQLNGYNTSCNTSEDAYLVVSATGGNSGFTFEWEDGTVGARNENLAAGTYNVTATDVNNCSSEENFEIVSPPSMILNASSDTPDCYGDTNGVVYVDSVIGGAAPYLFSLDGAEFSNNQAFGNIGSGTYQLEVQDANGCIDATEVVVDAVNEVVVSFPSSDTTIVLGESILLSPNTNIAITDSTFFWSSASLLDTLNEWRPLITPMNTVALSITVQDEFGCEDTAEILINVDKERNVYIPNAFNPYSTNSENNTFKPYYGSDVLSINQFNIFNRWGEMVYEASNLDNTFTQGWNGIFKGKEAQSGVYIYVIEITFIDGFTQVYSGDVTLIK